MYSLRRLQRGQEYWAGLCSGRSVKKSRSSMSPSYRIVFYVSGHGFGHASRAIEVVRAVLRARPDAHVVVKSSAPLHLFTEALDGRCESVALQCDAGVVQVDSLAVNTAETIRQAVEFQKQVPALAARESEYL